MLAVKSRNVTTAAKTKQYRTIEVNVKRIDKAINSTTFFAICSVNHLTPASEAEMENLLVPGSTVVPMRVETIEQNSPEFIDPPLKDWSDNAKPPAKAFVYDAAH